jgi:hypothetical protein
VIDVALPGGNSSRKPPGSDDPDFGPDLLSDPGFVPCRHESCVRRDLHREHDVVRIGRKIHKGYDKCPRCQTQVIVTKTRRTRSGTKKTRDVVKAECPSCGWMHTKALKGMDT